MNQTQSSTLPRSKTYEITITALMTAVTCILAPMSIPIGPVPISFTNLAIYLSLYLLGWKRGTISYLIYLLIGLVGLPVFSGFTGGPAKLAGPTGGAADKINGIHIVFHRPESNRHNISRFRLHRSSVLCCLVAV